MTAIFELVQITLGLATTAEMIATEVIKSKIKNFIEDHNHQLQILRDIQNLLTNTFKNSILNNQLSQYNLISAKLFSQIGENMVTLSDLSNQITAKYRDISPSPFVSSTKEYGMVSLVGVFTIYITTKFFSEQISTKFGQLKNPIQSLGTALKQALLKQRAIKKGVVQGQQGSEMEDLELENTFIQQQIPAPEKITLKGIWEDGVSYIKQNKLKALGNGLLGALRVVMVATGIIMFVQGVHNLQDLSDDYNNLKAELGPGGTIQKDQLLLMQVVSLIAADASNILYDTYNLILDLRNSIELILVNIPQLHDQLSSMALKLTAEQFLPNFNFHYLQSVSKLSGELFNLYKDGEKKYNKKKSSDPAGARSQLINNLENIKNKLNSLEPTDQQITDKTSKFPIAYSKTIKGLAEKLTSQSQIITLALSSQSGKLTKYKQFLSSFVTTFNDRSSQKQQDIIEQDPEYLKFIVGFYIQNFVNPNLAEKDHLPIGYVTKAKMQAALDAASTHDKYIKDNIARFITSFTIKFYGDDPTGQSVFGLKLKALKGLPDETIKHLMSEVNQIPNFISFPDQYPGQVEDPKAEKDGNLLSIKQLTAILEKVQPDTNPDKKKYEIIWKKRGKLMTQSAKTIGLIKYDTKTGNTYVQNQEFTKTSFTRVMIMKAVNKDTDNTSFYSLQDQSQDPRKPNWKFVELGIKPSPNTK